MADPTMFPWFSASFFIHSWLLSLHIHTHKHFLVCSWTLCQQQQTNDRTQVRFYSGRRDCGCRSGVSAFPAATPQTTPRHTNTQLFVYFRWRMCTCDLECHNENVLEFVSGSSSIPPNGFLMQPTIEILPEDSGKIFPEANTFKIVLKLPVHKDYESYKAQMCNAILWAPTFGMA